LAAGQFSAAAQAVANADLESGTFTSAGSFAGGTYQVFNNGTPQSWVRAIGAGDARWVNSTADHSPSGAGKYAYAYSTGDVVTGNDACLQNTLTGLTVGSCYTVSVFAAEAGGPLNNPAGNPGVMTLEFQNGPNASDFEYGRYFLPHNSAWSDSALTTIPWTQYSHTFTAKATSVVFWVSANAYNGVAGYMVADDVSVTAVTCAVSYDYGDLTITSTTFNTTGGGTAANAPRHQVNATGTLRLGSTLDAEANGQPSAIANGDDLATGPDEDGVTFPALVRSSAANLTVRVTGPNTGKLNAWIDWNNDGDFLDSGEPIASNTAMTGGAWNAPGNNTVSVTPPAAAVTGVPLAARFRLSVAGSDLPTSGTAVTGEIEDYVVYVVAASPTLDFGDLPDTSGTTGAGNYQTLLANGGPRHTIVSGLNIGAPGAVDAEANGVNSAATGDDLAGTDDEDGVIFPTFTPGQLATVAVTVNNPAGGFLAATLYGFIDFNNDGDFGDTGEATSVTVPDNTVGTVNLVFSVPVGAVLNTSVGARVRLTTDTLIAGDAGAQGAASNGEVEDYLVSVVSAVGTDYGDLPDAGAGTATGNYETTLASGGPRHVLSTTLKLGANVDADTGLVQGAGATLDDTTGSPDDEDGVNFTGLTFATGATVSLPVTVTLTGGGTVRLNAFFDWDNNGVFTGTGEAITELAVVVPGGGSTTVNLSVPVPTTAVTGASLGARFRISTAGGLTSVGSAPTGEVEDYVVTVVGTDYGDLPDAGAGTATGNYETTLASGGPRHVLSTTLKLGSTVDADTGLLQGAGATADDTTNTGSADDEDGVSIPALAAGSTATVVVNASGAGKVNAFFDWNNNGSFADPGETITELTVAAGNNNLSVPVPIGAVLNTSLGARFRISLAGGLTSVGVAGDGEVEDYVAMVTGQDYGDLRDTGTGSAAGNYRTLLSDNGPRHTIVSGLNLGSVANSVDADTGLLQNTAADQDDTTNTGVADDETGVASFPTFIAGVAATVVVNAQNASGGAGNATLYGFIDWNNDGDFGDTGEAVSVAVNDNTTGDRNLAFTVPVGAVINTSLGARFRLTTDTLTLDDAGAQGAASNGEVEDYLVSVIGYDYGDLPNTSFVTTTVPRHQVGALRLGTNIDVEAAGAGSTGADGDDLAGSQDDEDGVIFPASIARGQVLILPVIVTGGNGLLNAWIDWNNGGSFAASGEQIATAFAVTTGTNYLTVTVPSSAIIGSLGARFRLSVAGSDARSAGTAVTGEIEDYRISVVAAVRLGNKVWEDTDNDGVMDAGTESIGGGINGVGVTVYAADPTFGTPTGFPLSSLNTVANGATNGFYGFNLPPGDYVVVIPATNFASGAPLVGRYSSGTSTGTFNGIDPDTTATDRDDNGFNAINPASTGVRSPAVTLSAAGEPTGETDLGTGEPVVTDNSSNLTVDFGFTTSTPTAIKLGYVKGWWQDGQVTVEWETVSELNTLGFDLYRLDPAGRVRVNTDLVVALNVERGGVYRVKEPLARPVAPIRYLLVEQETTGRRIDYGPFEITVTPAARVAGVQLVAGTLELQFAGDPGVEYVIETTDDVVHGRWVPLGRFTADAEGWFRHRQPLPETGPHGFFRALRP
jgi:hypothetical protein